MNILWFTFSLNKSIFRRLFQMTTAREAQYDEPTSGWESSLSGVFHALSEWRGCSLFLSRFCLFPFLSLAAFRSSVVVFHLCTPPRFLFLSPSSFYPLSFFFSSSSSILLLPPRFLPLSPSFLYPLLSSLPPSPLSFFQLPIPLPFPNPPFLPHTLFTPRR